MSTPVDIPSVSYNTPFGDVGKVVWFEAGQNYNYFELSFNLTLLPYKKTNLEVYNNLTRSSVWNGSYPANIIQDQFLDYVRILNQSPTSTTQPYGLLNLP